MQSQCIYGALARKYKALKFYFAKTTTFKSNFDSNDFEIKECEGHDGIWAQDSNGIIIRYGNETWKNSHGLYDPPPINFVGSGGSIRERG